MPRDCPRMSTAYFIIFNRTLQGILRRHHRHQHRGHSAGRSRGRRRCSDRIGGAERLSCDGAALQPDHGYASYIVPAAFVLIIQQRC
jgi:hypothetical protein